MSDDTIFNTQNLEAGELPEVAPEKQPVERQAPNKERFDGLMNGDRSAVQQVDNPRTSLMDTVRDLSSNRKQGTATPESLAQQTQEAIQQIEAIKKTLEAPDITIKKTAQQLLSNKLSHIDDSLRVALSRAGVEYSPAPTAVVQEETGRVNPIERFLGFLADGQYQLQNLGDELRVMGDMKAELSPVSMLAIQVKVGQIQQELELFSSLLSNALSSIKTIMNIQV